MTYIVFVIVVIIFAFVGLLAVFRRYSTACPAWLIPLLENPYMNAVAGSETLLDRAQVQAGMTVLDVGCGPGRISIPAAQRVAPEGRVVALDLQPAMMSRLNERVASLGIDNIDTVLAGAGDGKVPSNAFDRVFLVTVLGEIVDQTAAMREIHEGLKPGGILSITEVLPDPHYQSKKRIRRLGESVGFQCSEQHGHWYAFTMNLRKPSGRDSI